MPFDKDFWTKLGAKHKLTQEQIDAIAANESLLQDIDEMVLRRDEAKGLKDQTEAEKRAAAQARQDALAKYQENLQWYSTNEAKLRMVDAYRAKYGDLDGDGGGRGQDPIIASPLTVDEVEKRIRGAQREVYTLNKEVLKADRDYQKRFGEPLPMDELEQIAMKPENAGRNFRDIYTDWVAPKVEAKSTADWDAKVKAAREAGEKEGMAKARMREPNASFPDEPNPFYEHVEQRDTARAAAAAKDKPAGGPDTGSLQRNFVETYYKNLEPSGAST